MSLSGSAGGRSQPSSSFGGDSRPPAKLASLTVALKQAASGQASGSPAATAVPGQTATLLPDGTVLVLGGTGDYGPLAQALIRLPSGGQAVQLAASLIVPRAWHSATLLPDGTVLVFGGIDAMGNVANTAELFDPVTQIFRVIETPGLTPRAYHTATLLTDGTVLIGGGVGGDGEVLRSAELGDPQSQTATPLSAELTTPRRNHSAALLPDGTVLLWGGIDDTAQILSNGDLYDPATQTFSQVGSIPEEVQASASGPTLAASIPENGAANVAVGAVLSLRFSEVLDVTSVNVSTVTVRGPSGNIPIKVVPAERGRLAFVTPTQALLPATSYTLSLSGLADHAKRSLARTEISFTTAALPVSSPAVDGEAWIPNGSNWRTARPDSTWQKQPPLQAPPGTTAIAGLVLKLNGEPLANVTLKLDTYPYSTRTDWTGRFLLTLGSRVSGHSVLLIEGATADRPGKTYGLFEWGMDVKEGVTNVLPFTIWMPLLDTAHVVTIPSPTKKDMVITSPLLPGLELCLPAGTVIYNYEGKIAHRVGLTPIPLDRTPFPIPPQFTMYYTIQPGGAWLRMTNPNGPKGAQLIYPNTFHAPAGYVYNFFEYDPDSTGWYVYGRGRVSPDRLHVFPDPGVVIYGFTGASIGSVGGYNNSPPANDCSFHPTSPPSSSPPGPTAPNPNPANSTCADPVDLSTGLFVYSQTDLTVTDVIPIALVRTYRPDDPVSRAFGIGATHPYDIFVVKQSNGSVDLFLADGSAINFVPISPGSSTYQCLSSPTSFYGSMFTDGVGGPYLTVTKKDGTTMRFPFGGGSAQGEAMIGFQDRYGNALTFTRDSNANLTKITSPNGRYIQFTLDSSGRITQAVDNVGRVVNYGYDESGRLTVVTDPNGGVTTYTYDSNNNMLTVTDPRGILRVTNQYDSNDRVTKQTEADGSVYQISYTLGSSNNVTQTTETDPLGNVRQTTFDSNGYTTSDTWAVGTPDQEVTTYSRSSSTELVSDMIDPLKRDTHYTYDGFGNTLTVTELYGTTGAVTTSYTYQQAFMPGLFSLPLSITDPLNHTTNFAYDGSGNFTTLTNPLNHQWTFTYNGMGQPLSASDPLSNTTKFAYANDDLISMTDPLLRTMVFGRDAAGRLVSLTDPIGAITQYQYDLLDDLTSTTDPLGNITSFAYDPDRDLTSITDPLNHVTSYTYDDLDRLLTRTDPLNHTESYTYDLDGNLHSFTDRKGQKTSFTYDPLNRLTKAAYADKSSTSYTYDLGNRLIQAKDSISGTIKRTYDNLDRLTKETTPQGSVSYAYDKASRRTTMTVAGQATVSYKYDNANRLTTITQGTSTFSLGYDNANRRTKLTLANGVIANYSYDAASELTGLTYQSGSTTLGSLTYAYDLDGRRTSIGGTYARTGLPPVVPSASYNADNQLTQWGSSALTYDLNGNLTNDSTNIYTWNARNQLASINSGTMATFQYDAFNRRMTKTISGASSSFLYDLIHPVQELSGMTVTANLVTGLAVDEIFSRTDSAGARYFLSDALRSTLALTDSTGASQTEYTYEAFGNTTVSGQASSNSYQYTGRENDSLGLYYYRARYYNPAYQRFTSEDPIDLTGADRNLYAYAENSPPNVSDPTGLAGTTTGVPPVLQFYFHPLMRLPDCEHLDPLSKAACETFKHCLEHPEECRGKQPDKPPDECQNLRDRQSRLQATAPVFPFPPFWNPGVGSGFPNLPFWNPGGGSGLPNPPFWPPGLPNPPVYVPSCPPSCP